jgi:hypothetical protein
LFFLSGENPDGRSSSRIGSFPPLEGKGEKSEKRSWFCLLRNYHSLLSVDYLATKRSFPAERTQRNQGASGSFGEKPKLLDINFRYKRKRRKNE